MDHHVIMIKIVKVILAFLNKLVLLVRLYRVITAMEQLALRVMIA
jgi:hypothetical protein